MARAAKTKTAAKTAPKTQEAQSQPTPFAANEAVIADIQKGGQQASNQTIHSGLAQGGQAASAQKATPKHKPETLAKHMADKAAEMVGQHTDTPFAAWDHATASQQAWWIELAKTAQAV